MALKIRALTAALLTGFVALQARSAEVQPDYLTDHPERLIQKEQGWGLLGINTCAHLQDQPGMPIKIGQKTYSVGLGHHAPGAILVDLEGLFDRFEAEVGVQPLPGDVGSAAFKVFGDDKLLFDSGPLKSGQPAKPVSVDVKGMDILRLEVNDAGDGINSDCANWAEARLIRSPDARLLGPGHRLEAAPFARVVTSDPARMDGCKATRTEEYRQEDVYLDRDLQPDDKGRFVVPQHGDGTGCIGLTWLERRMLRELALEFAEGSTPKNAADVQVQCWSGESAWQGGWKPMPGNVRSDGPRFLFVVDRAKSTDLRQGTHKIRWILPATARPATVQKLSAITATPTAEAILRVEFEKNHQASGLGIYNGEFEREGEATRDLTARPMKLRVRYTRPRPWKTDRTVLLFRLDQTAFGVAVDDVMDKGQVYVPAAGVYVARDDNRLDVAAYRKQTADQKRLLQEVRRMPDQTLAQAIAKVHNPAQNRSPLMLSLACDNHKFATHRDGLIEFLDPPGPNAATEMLFHDRKVIHQLRPKFGSGKAPTTRKLDGDGWMPIPVVMAAEDGVTYRQRSYVAPLGDPPLAAPGWLSPRPVCVSDFTIENANSQPAKTTLKIVVSTGAEQGEPARLEKAEERILALRGDRLLAVIDCAGASELKAGLSGGELTIEGQLPAGSSARAVAYIPGWNLPPAEQAMLRGADRLLERTRSYWENILAPTAQIDIPDKFLLNVIKASQVHCLIAARHEAEGARVAAWIGSVAYGPLESEANSIIRGLDYLGHHEFTRRAHDFFIHRYNQAGFLTTGYTLMGTGWQVWTLGMHYQLTHNAEWLRQVAPRVARVCNWIVEQRKKTQRPEGTGYDRPERGLMPPGVMADWNAYAYHFCLNGYYYAALQAAGEALSQIEYPGAKNWLAEADDFRKAILRSYHWTQARMPVYLLRDGTGVVAYPSQVHSPGPLAGFFPGEDANRSWCYDVELGPHHLVPLGVLDPGTPEVGEMMDHHEDVQFLADGWFDYPAERNHQDPYNLGGFAKVQPYYCRNAEIYAMRDDVKPFIRSYYNTLPSLLNLEVLSLQEHFNGVAAWNKTHETGYFLHQSRLMMVMERGQELWLAPFVTSNWMQDGQRVAIRNAPTHFGPVSYQISSSAHSGYIDATIEPPTRSVPAAICIRMRHPEGKRITDVTVFPPPTADGALLSGQPHRDFDPVREFVRVRPAGQGPIRVRAAYQ